MKTLGRQIANARNETAGEKRRGGEDEIREAAGIGILLPDPSTGPGHDQPVQQAWGLVHRGRDELRGERTELIGDMWSAPLRLDNLAIQFSPIRGLL